jgi:hypothetical protein
MLDVKELHAKAIKLNKKIDKLSAEYTTITQQIKDNCPHDEVEGKSSWSYGGYDYQGEDRSWQECKLCGETFNLKIRYTGFG